jgi:glycosyltransferase involved in cell wall biosynthesis
MVESMAAGTPVLAMNLGSAAELIVHGKTGFLCHSIDECVSALDRVPTIDRRVCREHVVSNFSVKRMVDGYEAVYQQLVNERFAQNGQSRSAASIASKRS